MDSCTVLRPRLVETASQILAYLAMNEDGLADGVGDAVLGSGISSEELAQAKMVAGRWFDEDSRLASLPERVREYYIHDARLRGYLPPGTEWSMEALRQAEAKHYD